MNTEEIKKIILRIKSDKKAMLIIFIGLLGIILIMLSGSESEKKTETDNNNQQIILSERELACDVEKFIENIDGAGKSKVILTFDSFEETVYAIDKNESFSQNGNSDVENKYVIIDNDKGEGGMQLKIISPKIRGVAVLCKGGDNPIVKEQIITAISALFDISTNKISVATMAN